MADSLHDPRLDALETAAILVGASDRDELLERGGRPLPAGGGRPVVGGRRPRGRPGPGRRRAGAGRGWLVAFVEGSQSSARVASGEAGPDDVVWSPLPSAGLALVVGRDGTAYRARERRSVAALARIVDTRFRELTRFLSMTNHPSARR